ncbi:unnamed protein product [Rotaria socialis]|uniref:MATH domain-containing protein n=1 Tax=Rotaria socialis TaxID=392032 RepID=A0A820KA24_9BILA|nr:unnamed protein product [Rotaria socialis]CAF4178214.1 unnamed protein product [Rotaria socialis]CAF4338519.1 unnamed protein product [Rotaria socialis]
MFSSPKLILCSTIACAGFNIFPSSPDCNQHWTTVLLQEILNQILMIFVIYVLVFSFLVYAYISYNPLRANWLEFIREKSDVSIEIILLIVVSNLGGIRISTSIRRKSLDRLLTDRCCHLLPLEISVYDEDDDNFEWDEKLYQSQFKSIYFRRVRRKPNRNSLTSQSGFRVKNIAGIDQRFICQLCRLVLREPYQLRCGHHRCQLCIDEKQCITHWSTCTGTCAIKSVRFDADFQTELECLLISCYVCNWTGPLKKYQEHLDDNHGNRFLICSLCNKQILRRKITEHYMTQAHQLMLINIILHLQSIKNKTHLQQQQILANAESVLDTRVKQIRNQFHSQCSSLQLQKHELLLIKTLAQEMEYCLQRKRAIQDVCTREVLQIERNCEQKHLVSFNGILIWNINNFQEKFDDAKSERQRSIYSPEFYSAYFGYKMCARLFLNGTNDVRNTHMSIFFILMSGEYDAILHWPFHFKVIFSLLNQSTAVGSNLLSDLSKSIWPNTRSACFQRPRLAMNEAYGIKRFIALDEFQMNRTHFVQNDTIFIKIELDFMSTPPENRSDAGEMLMIDEQHMDTVQEDLMRKIVFFNG